jgi:hypothetical protein
MLMFCSHQEELTGIEILPGDRCVKTKEGWGFFPGIAEGLPCELEIEGAE